VSLSPRPGSCDRAVYGVRPLGIRKRILNPGATSVAASSRTSAAMKGLLYDVFASTRRVFFGVRLGNYGRRAVGFLLAGIARRGRSPIP